MGAILNISNLNYVRGPSISEQSTESSSESVGNSDINAKATPKTVYTRLNYFGLFLLSASIIVFLIPVFFPGVAPNGYEVLVYIAWGTVIFIFAMIFLVITNLFKFLSKDDDNNSEPKSSISWFTIIKVPILTLILMYPLTLL